MNKKVFPLLVTCYYLRTPLLQVIYLAYLATGPWFWGQALDDPEAPLASFHIRHWNVPLDRNGASVKAPMPCTLILAMPFFLLVLFPWMLWIAAFSAYRDIAKRPALKASLSIPPRKGGLPSFLQCPFSGYT